MTASSSNSHLLPSSLHSYEAPEIRTIPKTTIKNARNASALAAMPSSPYNTVSSPPASNGARSGRSRFTYRQLAQLAGYNPSNPLRVIAHIDLDAFYAQCEMIRLGVPENQPLAVQQWQGLIAINYPAREFGIGRHCNVTEAKKLCPSLIAQHVATWREGEDKWAYREDADANIASDKVSLDPYRLQSRKILATIRESLPPGNLQKVEKASIDEVFLDLSAHIRTELLQRFPELSAPPPYDDLNENLPLPSIVALDWKADALVDLDQDQETLDPDWDDVAMLIGSEIVRDVREKVRSELGYTCSAGVASNKLLSKLGSAHKKPNCQTVVRNRAVDKFLEDFKFTKIRNLGGKLGDQVVSTFDTENVKDLLLVSLDQMKSKLGDETGPWLYNTIRGIDHSEVSPRTQIKSMLSAKSFRPSITKTEQAHKWLRIFVADIFARLVEEGVLENKRRPKTMHLSLRHGGQSRSRQGPIVQGRPIDESILLDLAKDLFAQILSEAGSVWPCYNLSLSVGGFEEGIKNNMGIGAFLLKGDEAATLRSQQQQHDSRPASPERPSKRQKAEDSGIQRFFARHGTPDERPDDATPDKEEEEEEEEKEAENDAAALKCDRCGAKFDALELLQSHADWHMAKDLQDEEDRNSHPAQDSSATARPPQRTLGAAASRRGSVGGTKRGSNQKKEHGQSKLKFG